MGNTEGIVFDKWNCPLGESKSAKKIIIDGKTYLNTVAIMDVLYVNERCDLGRWRRDGLPYIKVVVKRSSTYFYNVEDCNRWFAGEEFVSSEIGRVVNI